ncbi:DinB family protein [Gaetbulibacter aestuarii]|uniref:DinB family protein n=1 Tax=Gaetbulibacter aestuarii TaxID=1502358 RepID=A0ABW7MVJ2_9FLAO
MTFTFDVFTNIRPYFQQYLEKCSLETLNKIPKGYNNNIIWNIGHVLVTSQILCYKLSGLPMHVSDAMVAKYQKGSKPEGPVSQAEVDEIKELLKSTLSTLESDYQKGAFNNFQEYTVSTTGNTLKSVDDALQFALFHEGLHLGYIMALIRAVKN